MNRVNYIFANVDHSKVTTGLLSDYGLQVILPEYYDGTLRDNNEVDMGNGFHTISWDTPFEVTYLSSGNKELTIEFAFRDSS